MRRHTIPVLENDRGHVFLGADRVFAIWALAGALANTSQERKKLAAQDARQPRKFGVSAEARRTQDEERMTCMFRGPGWTERRSLPGGPELHQKLRPYELLPPGTPQGLPPNIGRVSGAPERLSDERTI